MAAGKTIAESNPVLSQPAVARNLRLQIPLISILIFVLSMTLYLPTIETREFHRDEARWIHRAIYVKELAHPLSDYWDESTWATGESLDHRNRLRAQPPVGSYVIGLGFLLQGYSLPEIGYWNMDHDTAWNAARDNMPSEEMLKVARRTTATITALTAVILFLIGNRLTSLFGAAAGAIVFAIHPLTEYLATFAGSDATLVFFIALSALLAARLAEKPTWIRTILLGAAIGLGGGVKLSPLGISIALAGVGVLLLIQKTAKAKKLGIHLIALPVVAGLTFILSYPYLWKHPVEHSLNLLRYRTMSFDLQGSLWDQVAIETRFEAINRIWTRFGSEEWSVLGSVFGWSVPLEGVLAVIGVFVLAFLVIRRGLGSSTALIAATIGASTIITVMGMQIDWARYHFPILLALAICIGVTIGAIELWIRRVWVRR